jgi:tRNA modification GTPase
VVDHAAHRGAGRQGLTPGPSGAEGDTIAAVATAAGRGGIGIVRVSGPRVRAIMEAMLGGAVPPRRAVLRRFLDAGGEALDTGLALFFPAPRSFTGEDVLELHGHGGPVVLDLVLARVMELGARAARPGEFSERAFLNGRLDLAQAEAVADLVDADSPAAARAAMRSLQGAFSAEVRACTEALTALRVYVEAALDFPEEEIDFLADPEIGRRLDRLQEELAGLLGKARQGVRLREGLQVVLCGAPNVGKSTLLNRLSREELAITSHLPGTTRDLLRADLQIAGIPVRLVDTAGLREGADPVEREGVRRAQEAVARADVVVWVLDPRRPPPPAPAVAAGSRLLRVWNKADLASPPAELREPDDLVLSARTGEGLDRLEERIRETARSETPGEGVFLARRRHLDALRRAREAVSRARGALAEGPELAAEELRLAQDCLGEITGRVTTEDLLGRIFASFCIGK